MHADGTSTVLVVAYFAGALTHLYPEPDDTRRFLDEERASWDEFERRLDERA